MSREPYTSGSTAETAGAAAKGLTFAMFCIVTCPLLSGALKYNSIAMS